MKMLTLALVILAASPAAAQQRIGGLALVAGGAFMVLASGTCEAGEPHVELGSLYGVPTRAEFTPAGVSGGTFPGSACTFSTVRYRGSAGALGASNTWSYDEFQNVPFLDDRQGVVGGGTISGRIAATIEKGRNPAMLYGGLAAIAGGIALAVLSPGAGTPALDVQAGPHGVRLSRTFGF